MDAAIDLLAQLKEHAELVKALRSDGTLVETVTRHAKTTEVVLTWHRPPVQTYRETHRSAWAVDAADELDARGLALKQLVDVSIVPLDLVETKLARLLAARDQTDKPLPVLMDFVYVKAGVDAQLHCDGRTWTASQVSPRLCFDAIAAQLVEKPSNNCRIS